MYRHHDLVMLKKNNLFDIQLAKTLMSNIAWNMQHVSDILLSCFSFCHTKG